MDSFLQMDSASMNLKDRWTELKKVEDVIES